MASSIIAFRPDEVLQGSAGEPVRVQWLGTAGFRISYAGHVLLVDPYLSRPSLARCAVRPVEPEPRIVARHIDRADAIVVGHTHFDHVLDVPQIARMTGAVVYGSWSAARLCHGQGVPDRQVRVVEQGVGQAPAKHLVGPFEVSFLPSRHSSLFAGRIPYPGEVRVADRPMRIGGYRCGAVFVIEIRVGGRLIVHLGSARLEEHEPAARADLALVCVTGWRSSPDFPERVVSRYAPRSVVLSHWDDFFRGLELPVRALPGLGMAELARRMGGRKVGTLELMQSVRL